MKNVKRRFRFSARLLCLLLLSSLTGGCVGKFMGELAYKAVIALAIDRKVRTLDVDSLVEIDRVEFSIQSNDARKNEDNYEITDPTVLEQIRDFCKARADGWSTLYDAAGNVSSVDVLGTCYKDGEYRYGIGVSRRLEEFAYLHVTASFVNEGIKSLQVRKISLQEQAEFMRLLGIVERDLWEADYDIVEPAHDIGKDYGKTFYLRGHVYAEPESVPLYWADIALYKKKAWESYQRDKTQGKPYSPRETATDESGYYSIHYFVRGSPKTIPGPEDFVLVISKPGFVPVTVTVESFPEDRVVILARQRE